MTRRFHFGTFWPHIILVPLAVVMAVPLYWALKTSFTGENLFTYPPSLVPLHPQLFYYAEVVYWIPFLRYFFNSIVVAAIVVASNILMNAMAGYGLRQRFPGKRLILLLFLGLAMIPFQTTVVPAFLVTKKLGLLNNLVGVALPQLATIINIFVFRSAFDATPTSLADAARMDGVREFGILFRIYLPLAKAAIATNIILSFVWSWNNFLWPLIIIKTQNVQTMPLGLANFYGYFETGNGPLYAFTILVIAPIVLVFLLSQRGFMASMVSSAVKE